MSKWREVPHLLRSASDDWGEARIGHIRYGTDECPSSCAWINSKGASGGRRNGSPGKIPAIQNEGSARQIRGGAVAVEVEHELRLARALGHSPTRIGRLPL